MKNMPGIDQAKDNVVIESHPHVSVVIPTRNRPDDVERTLDSVARIEYPCWDITVVDQSDDGRTQEIVERYRHLLPHLGYHRIPVKGLSHARNVGIEETSGEIIALLDDDCTVQPDWLTQAVHGFDRHPHAGFMYGELRPFNGLPEWSTEGWIPARLYQEEFEANVIGNFRQRIRLWPHLMGNGACLFIRRSVWQRVGPFDVHLGAGARYRAAEDGDWTYRALTAGYSMVGTPAIAADHYGVRDYGSGAAGRLLYDYYYGIAAFLIKELRLGDPYALVWILHEMWQSIARIRLRNIISRGGPTGLTTLVAFIHGLAASFALRIDRKNRLYAARTIR